MLPHQSLAEKFDEAAENETSTDTVASPAASSANADAAPSGPVAHTTAEAGSETKASKRDAAWTPQQIKRGQWVVDTWKKYRLNSLKVN